MKILHGFVTPRLTLLAVFILASITGLEAQTLVTAPMTGTPAAGSYYGYNNITLSPGFSFVASAGNSLQLYIQAAPDCQPISTSPSQSQNYVMTSTPRIVGYNPTASGYSTCDVMQAIQYLDGLGRQMQTVQVKGSPLGYDIVQPTVYDQYGRDSVKYLPYSCNSATPGAYRPNAVLGTGGSYNTSEQYQFYQQTGQGYVNTTAPYAYSGYEPSPLSRVREQGAPGTAWQSTGAGNENSTNHTVRTVDTLNDATSTFANTPVTYNAGSKIAALYLATINSNYSETLSRSGSTNYAAGQLTVTIARDENWQPSNGCLGTTEEYKDKEGHMVLRRTYNLYNGAVQMLSTYYVYDNLGNLAFVLPPGANPDNAGVPASTVQNNLCYQYQYDSRNRLIQKKLPGKGWDIMVYNNLDQLIATQDSVHRGLSPQQVAYSKYDSQGRVIQTGYYTITGTAGVNYRTTLQSTAIADTTLWETKSTSGMYSNLAVPTANATVLVTNYYDDYNISGLPAGYKLSSGVSSVTRGLPTATLTAVLNTPTDNLWTVHYYDDLGREVQTFKQHYLGGTANTANYDAIATTYDFTNAPTTATRKHFTTASTTVPAVTVFNRYLYDHMGRKKKSWEQITIGSNSPGNMTLLSQLNYNEIGQLWNKQLHSTDSINFLQPVTYAYNERGWLFSSSAALFSMQLAYNSGANPQYNGNISSQSWSSANSTGSYVYTYDAINRLTSGATPGGQYIERGITYDMEGNINSLSRVYAGTLIDSLTYSYGGTNQLQSVTDNSSNAGIGYKAGTSTYAYDGNGNMISDNSKGITGSTGIVYNMLNLPQSISSMGMVYTYDATGQKLRRAITSGTTTTYTDYIGGIEYDGTSAAAETITFIQTEEGRALPNGTNYNYEYVLTDHLGDARLTFDSATGVARTEQQDNYLPFGLDINVPPIGSPQNFYLYNKKELQPVLVVYDYGARFYDPVIARWTVVDPLAEKYRRFSSYAYTGDNPIRFIDPDGMQWGDNAKQDQKIADRLQKRIGSRIKQETAVVDKNTKIVQKAVAELAGGNFSGLGNLVDAATNISGAKAQISDLHASSSELTQMGSKGVAQKFDFQEISANVGNTDRDKNGTIVMQVTSDANAIHEAAHGIQDWHNTTFEKGWERVDNEIVPYQRQYSFDPSAVSSTTVPSVMGEVNSRADITRQWVSGINDPTTNPPTFIYSSGLTADQIKNYWLTH